MSLSFSEFSTELKEYFLRVTLCKTLRNSVTIKTVGEHLKLRKLHQNQCYKPKKVHAFNEVCSATFSTEIPLNSATVAATKGKNLGSFLRS
jgi:hypothetical protein